MADIILDVAIWAAIVYGVVVLVRRLKRKRARRVHEAHR